MYCAPASSARWQLGAAVTINKAVILLLSGVQMEAFLLLTGSAPSVKAIISKSHHFLNRLGGWNFKAGALEKSSEYTDMNDWDGKEALVEFTIEVNSLFYRKSFKGGHQGCGVWGMAKVSPGALSDPGIAEDSHGGCKWVLQGPGSAEGTWLAQPQDFSVISTPSSLQDFLAAPSILLVLPVHTATGSLSTF